MTSAKEWFLEKMAEEHKSISKNGTPKNLREAIDNGIDAYTESCMGKKSISEHMFEHLEDFFNQRFGAEVLKHEELADILIEIKNNMFKAS